MQTLAWPGKAGVVGLGPPGKTNKLALNLYFCQPNSFLGSHSRSRWLEGEACLMAAPRAPGGRGLPWAKSRFSSIAFLPTSKRRLQEWYKAASSYNQLAKCTRRCVFQKILSSLCSHSPQWLMSSIYCKNLPTSSIPGNPGVYLVRVQVPSGKSLSVTLAFPHAEAFLKCHKPGRYLYFSGKPCSITIPAALGEWPST